MRGNVPVYSRAMLLGVLLVCLTACGAAAAPAPSATPATTSVAPTTTAPLSAPTCPNAPVTLSPPLFHLPSVEFHDGLARVVVANQYGFIDRCGAFVVPPQFTDAGPFSQGLAAVNMAGKWGYVDTHGTLVISPHYDGAGQFAEGLARVSLGGLTGYIDATGAPVIALQFAAATNAGDSDSDFSDGLAAMRGADGTWGYIDHIGAFVIPPQFAYAHPFTEGLALVSTTERTQEDAFIDHTGAKVISVPPGRSIEFPFAGGLAVVREGGKSGYMDRTGRLVTPLQFDRAYPLADGRGLVSIAGHYGYIDPSGAYALPPQYVVALSFSEGWAAVATDSTQPIVCIDPQGAVALQLTFDCGTFNDGVAITSKAGDANTAIDRTGKVLFTYSVAYPTPVP